VVFVTGAFLVYGTLDMPAFGAAENPVHGHVVPRYLEESGTEIGIPNVVTSVLASYRGYDTLGETAVIFTAGMGVLVLLGSARRLRRKRGND
jgi:multicomponent Na+:H+ antiporter subunit B